MSNYSGVTLGNLDDIFSVQPKVITDVYVSKLHPFKDHPFRVDDDEAMDELVESIKENGVLEPPIVRRDPLGYEILSGHRRKRACEIIGLEKIPVHIIDADDDEAAIFMVDANLRREVIRPSEKAWAYRIKNDAIKHQGKSGGLSVEQMAAEGNDSKTQIKRYIRLTYLTKELLDLVDEGMLGISAAVELSFLKESEQEHLYSLIQAGEWNPSLNEAQILKKASQESSEVIDQNRVEILLGIKEDPEEHVADMEFYEAPEYETTNIDNTVMLPDFVEPNGEDEAGEKEIKFNRVADLERNITTDIVLPYKKLKHYFPDDWTEKEKKDLIFALLDNWLVQEKYKT